MRIPWIPVSLVLFAGFAVAGLLTPMPTRGLFGLAALGALTLMKLD